MVIEKIKDFFGGEEKKPEKEEQRTQKRELTLGNLGQEIEKEKETTIEETKTDLRPMLSKIEDHVKNIESLRSELKDAKPNEDVHPNIQKSTNEAKRLLLRKLGRATEKIETPSEPSWDRLIDFNRNLQDTVNLLKNARLSHGNQVANLFEDRINQLIRLTDRLQNLSKELNTTLRKSNLKIKDLDDLMEKVSKRKEHLDEIREQEVSLQKLKKNKDKLEEKIEEAKKSLSSLKQSSRYDELKELKEKIEGLEQENEDIRRKIDSTISELDRPLRKMNKLIERDEHMVSKEVLDGIDSYLEKDPVQSVFQEEENLPNLKTMLSELKTVLKEKMKLEEKEREKRISEVEEILENDKVQNLRKRHEKAERKNQELKEEIESSPLLEKKENLEDEIKEHQSKLKEVKEKIEGTEEELSEIEKKLEEKNEEIKKSVESIFGAELKEN